MTPKLICITGPDGCGKSTLVKGITALHPDLYIAGIWDMLHSGMEAVPFRSKQEVDSYLCSLTPNARLLFLAHAMRYAVDKALVQGKPVLIDSYYYKYFVSELALGADVTLTESLAANFLKPDVVIQLRLDVYECANRKQNFSRYECGLAVNAERESFIAFQKKTKKYWSNFPVNNLHTVDASRSIEPVRDEVLSLLNL